MFWIIENPVLDARPQEQEHHSPDASHHIKPMFAPDLSNYTPHSEDHQSEKESGPHPESLLTMNLKARAAFPTMHVVRNILIPLLRRTIALIRLNDEGSEDPWSTPTIRAHWSEHDS
jgi:hypothetical protein